jgi:hypothetical protein
MRETRRDHYLTPAVGADAADALEKAIDELARARNLDASDPTAALHLLASLAAAAQARLGESVAGTRAYGCSWAEVADLLGVTRASAWQRWGGADRRDTDASQSDERGPARREPSPKP